MAIIVTATPVTRVSGSPALKVSTVSACHGTPTCDLMRSTICAAVGAAAACAEGAAAAARWSDTQRSAMSIVVSATGMFVTAGWYTSAGTYT